MSRLLEQGQTERAAQMTRQGFRPTQARALDQSLQDLLNAGYGIVSAQPMGTGQGFTLRDAGGRSWVFCVLAPRPSGEDFASLCRALN